MIGRNTLTTGPPAEDAGGSAIPVLPEDSCAHQFVTTLEPDNVLPQQDTRPGPTSVYELQTACRKCRLHVQLHIEYRDGHRQTGGDFFACPNQEYPLHHFQHISEQRAGPKYYAGAPSERAAVPRDAAFVFRCSARQCLAKLTIATRCPRLSDSFIRLITDPSLLQARVQSAMELDPSRGDLAYTVPASNYDLLCIFLTHSLDPNRERKTIKSANRRFLTTFGSDCNELLQSLGFVVENDEDGVAWALPDPSKHSDPDAFAAFINDVRNELALLYFGRSDQERASIRRLAASTIPAAPPSSMRLEMARCLGYANYDKTPLSRRSPELTEELQL